MAKTFDLLNQFQENKFFHQENKFFQTPQTINNILSQIQNGSFFPMETVTF